MSVSQITDYLYIAPRRLAHDVGNVRRLGVRLVISMIALRRPPRALSTPPLRVLWLQTVDFPLLPIPVRTLNRGVEVALPVIRDGHRVLVFCEGGRHRSVAMASAILIGTGYSADEAMRLVAGRREVADPWAWHIQRQIRRFEAHWETRVQRGSPQIHHRRPGQPETHQADSLAKARPEREQDTERERGEEEWADIF
jgi:protein tyrosine phosphatase (PTP) superfamily phosphohydrolase (DUF442 family)